MQRAACFMSALHAVREALNSVPQAEPDTAHFRGSWGGAKGTGSSTASRRSRATCSRRRINEAHQCLKARRPPLRSVEAAAVIGTRTVMLVA
jgi:hypothetical protein